jgi:hypothetical protein
MKNVQDKDETKTPEQQTIIDRFSGDFGFLSNFYPSTIYVDGERYPTVEHAFQAMKTMDPTSRRLIRLAKTPGIAKKMGRCVGLRPDWESVKYPMMLDFVRKKFDNPFLRPMLLATADATLIEGNTWNDRVWGVCDGVGQNNLGKILMQVRDELLTQEDSVSKDDNKVP